MSIDRLALRAVYARLKGLERTDPQRVHVLPRSIGQDFDRIVKQLQTLLPDEQLEDFHMPRSAYDNYSSEYCDQQVFAAKLMQIISYLEFVHHLGKEVIEVGTLYNSIKDEQLRNRCADLLSAPSSFDRVINQATQVLEDRIRTKSKNEDHLTGAPLVNKVWVSDLSKTILIVSDNPDEHRGYCDIIRGMVGAFRNPTHHQISEEFSREDALKVCAFVDSLLRVVDQAKLRN